MNCRCAYKVDRLRSRTSYQIKLVCYCNLKTIREVLFRICRAETVGTTKCFYVGNHKRTETTTEKLQ